MPPDATRVWIALIPVLGSALTATIALLRSLKEKTIDNSQSDKAQLWDRVKDLEGSREENEKRAAVREAQMEFVRGKLNTLRYQYIGLDSDFRNLLEDYVEVCVKTNTSIPPKWAVPRPPLKLDWEESDFPRMPDDLKPHPMAENPVSKVDTPPPKPT